MKSDQNNDGQTTGQANSPDGLSTQANSAANIRIESAKSTPDNSEKEGEEGTPPLPLSNAGFVAAVMGDTDEGTSAALCSISGEPSGAWPALRPDNVDLQCPENNNNYLNCSSFKVQPDGGIRAMKEAFSAYHFVMLDDVGTKIVRSQLDGFTPTWEIETSPGNFQVGIKLATPITDQNMVASLQNAVVAAGLCDPGSKSSTRWARLPNAINGKKKHRRDDGSPFRSQLAVWNPDVSYTVEQLVDHFSLDMTSQSQAASTSAGSYAGQVNRPFQGDAVFTPRPSENPVLTALKASKLYKRQIGAGKHDITCPWCNQHTDDLDSGTAYIEPSDDYPVGGFCCQHSHGGDLSIRDLLNHLDVDWDEARGLARIRVISGELNRVTRAAERVLASMGDYYQSGGVIMAVREDPATGSVSTELVNEQMLQMALSEAAIFQRREGKSNSWIRIDPPSKVVQSVLKVGTFHHLPVLKGLARQPFFRECDGELVTEPGYDGKSGIYAHFNRDDFNLPEPTELAAREALHELKQLLGEFHFEEDVDRSAALSAILTATVRPTLPLAPAYNIRASSPGSGKSYLARTITPFGSATSSLTVGYPITAEEASKSMLAALLQGPAAVVFDDMQSDWKAHAVMNRLLTSETITERVLGVSRAATVSTRALFLGTGNNIGPVADMTRRVITIRLHAPTATPTTLRYKGKPVQQLAANRGKYVSLALTIVRAWLAAGEPRADVPDIASYDGLWTDLCRQPLLWLGEPDPATSLIEQVQDDPYVEALGYLLQAWHRCFGDSSVTVRKVILKADEDVELFEALQDLPIMERGEINSGKLGWYLKKQARRIVGGLEIRDGDLTERKSWRVVRVSLKVAKGVNPFYRLSTSRTRRSD